MSSNNSSLAVEEVKEPGQEKAYEIDFEPKLKVLINKRLVNDSDFKKDTEIVRIGGRITISF